jgi:hypothetical protein
MPVHYESPGPGFQEVAEDIDRLIGDGRRLGARLGAPKAVVAMAHHLARLVWHCLEVFDHQADFLHRARAGWRDLLFDHCQRRFEMFGLKGLTRTDSWNVTSLLSNICRSGAACGVASGWHLPSSRCASCSPLFWPALNSVALQ